MGTKSHAELEFRETRAESYAVGKMEEEPAVQHWGGRRTWLSPGCRLLQCFGQG